MRKKNVFKSISAIFIVAILAFSIVACGKTGNSASESDSGSKPNAENPDHSFAFKETNDYLIKNGIQPSLILKMSKKI